MEYLYIAVAYVRFFGSAMLFLVSVGPYQRGQSFASFVMKVRRSINRCTCLASHAIAVSLSDRAISAYALAVLKTKRIGPPLIFTLFRPTQR